MKKRRLASRFAVLKRDRRRVTWFPVALRWRRPRPRLQTPRFHRAATPLTLQAAWLAHFHLHFASPPRELSRRAESRRVVSVTTMYRVQRIASTPHSTNVRNLAYDTHMHRVYGAPMAVHHATRNISPVTVFRQTSRTATRSVIVAGGRSTVFTVVRKELRAETVRQERARSVEQVHRRERHLFRLLSSTRVDHVKRLLQETVTAPQAIIRPAVIVWRRESRPGLENADGSTRAERVVSSSRSIPLESIERSMRPAAALQEARLDMDRLTDDVIRRVERRMRIERERRGL